MDNIDVRIVRLEAMRVAGIHGFGESPERLAGEKLRAWAEAEDRRFGDERRVFGFNNPDPAPGSPN